MSATRPPSLLLRASAAVAVQFCSASALSPNSMLRLEVLPCASASDGSFLNSMSPFAARAVPESAVRLVDDHYCQSQDTDRLSNAKGKVPSLDVAGCGGEHGWNWNE